MDTFIYVIISVFLIILIAIVSLYNNLISKQNEIKNAFGTIDAMLKKRYDLIPNLVETVKAYMSHEEHIFLEVTRLRSQMNEQKSNTEKLETDKKISKNINGLLMAVENYPSLKASQNFILLQDSWNESEEQIAASRRFYNSAVTDYNIAIQSFPSNIIANYLKLTAENVISISEEERKNIDAKKLFNN
ncbi:MAG: LemA family protein [Bacteroidetes bacterium]|nr:LemA family protein [Bacteroidota bacterium]